MQVFVKNLIPIYRKFLICGLLTLSILLSYSILIGQTGNSFSFNSWQKEDGLPSNNVNAVAKDHMGFLWIATLDGLCRFDGDDMIKVYRQETEEGTGSNSLKSDNIRTIYCDRNGTLWIGTRFGGLTRFQPETNEWKTYLYDSLDVNSLSNNEVLNIFEDSKNRIWVGTEDGLNLLDQNADTFTRFRLDQGKGGHPLARAVLTIMEDQNGWIWVGTWAGGLHLLLTDDNGNLSKQEFRSIQLGQDKASNNIWDIYQDREGRNWIATHGGGLFLMNVPEQASNQIGHQNWTPTFHKYFADDLLSPNIESNAFQDILQDQFGNIWIGSVFGLYFVPAEDLPDPNMEERQLIPFRDFWADAYNNSTIVGNNIMNLYEDDQGMIWIGTTNGLCQYNWYSNQFSTYFTPESIDRLPYASNLFIDDSGLCWIAASEKGLLTFRVEGQKTITIREDYSHLILGDNVNTICSPDGEWLYAGTELGVTALNMKTLATRKYPAPDWLRSHIQDLIISSITVDKEKRIWFGTKVGLFTIDPASNTYTLYEPLVDDQNSLSDLSVNQIFQDSTGAIWVATYSGLNRAIQNPNGTYYFQRFLFQPDAEHKGPVDNAIMCLEQVGEKLYIGTLSGLCSFNLRTEEFEAYNFKNYRFWIRGIEKTKDQNLWISINEGIFFFDTQDKMYKAFDAKDGLIDTDYRLGSSFTDAQSNIYFGFVNGFTRFNPNTFGSNKISPPVYITEIEKMNPRGIELVNGIYEDEIELKHDDYRLSVNFAALNYNRADKNQYAYRLEGFDEHWNVGKLGTPIVYTNLMPKEYTLVVKAANNDGLWNEEGVSLKIIQYPAYWQTLWFRLASIIVGGTCIFWIFGWYTNKIRKHNEQLQAFNKDLSKEVAQRIKIEEQLQEYNKELERSNKDLEQFAYAASHDLKEPLRVIGNFSGLLARRYKNELDSDAFDYIDFIQDGVRRMSNLISSLLTYSKLGTKESVYEIINLNQLIQDKLSDLSEVIKEKNANIDIAPLPSIVGEREQIGMVFFNLIHNAIKFNDKDNPVVQVQEVSSSKPGFWQFSVKDNGIGIAKEYQDKIFGIFKRLHGKKEYEGTGIGLAVCQKIILRHNGMIWLESEPGLGTTFYFTIKKDLGQVENKELDGSKISLPL